MKILFFKIITLSFLICAAAIFADAQTEKKEKDPLNHGVKMKNQPAPRLNESVKRKGLTGTILFKVEFLADGKIGTIEMIKQIPNNSWTTVEMDKEAIRAIKGFKFEPAVKDGQPVTVFKTVQFTLQIPGR